MRTVARWCFRHRLVVVATWLVAVIACTAVQHGVGSGYADNFSLPNTESAQATRLLQQAAPAQSGDTDQLVVAVDHGSVRNPAVRARTEAVIRRVARLPHVGSVTSPYSAAGAGQIAPSRRGCVRDRQLQPERREPVDCRVRRVRLDHQLRLGPRRPVRRGRPGRRGRRPVRFLDGDPHRLRRRRRGAAGGVRHVSGDDAAAADRRRVVGCRQRPRRPAVECDQHGVVLERAGPADRPRRRR